MGEPSVEVQLARLIEWRTAVEAHITATDISLEALKLERNNALKWGILVLGSAVLTMIGFIAMFVKDHLTFQS